LAALSETTCKVTAMVGVVWIYMDVTAFSTRDTIGTTHLENELVLIARLCIMYAI